MVTEPGAIARVGWAVDGQPLGRATHAPFVPRDGTGDPVPLPLTTLAPGTHEVVVTLYPDGSTGELVATFATSDAHRGVERRREGNHQQGGLPGSVGISTKLTQMDQRLRSGREPLRRHRGLGIPTGGEGPIIIRANTFSGVHGETAVRVRATRADTADIQVSGNVIGSMPNASSRALYLQARSGRTLSTVRIEANSVTNVAFGVSLTSPPMRRSVRWSPAKNTCPLAARSTAASASTGSAD